MSLQQIYLSKAELELLIASLTTLLILIRDMDVEVAPIEKLREFLVNRLQEAKL